MSENKQPDQDQRTIDGDDEDSKAILSRREFLIKSALVGMGVAVTAACGGDDKAESQACLSIALDAQQDTVDDQPQACLEPLPEDMFEDQQPQVCLTAPLEDVKAVDDVPQACLSIAIDSDNGDA